MIKQAALAIIYLSSMGVWAQNTLNGRLTDAVTGEAVSDASLFLLELNKGTISASDGSFTLKGIGPGQHTLVVTHLGYQPVLRRLEVSEPGALAPLDLPLFQEPLHMDEVVVTGAFAAPRRDAPYAIAVEQTGNMQRHGSVVVMDQIRRIPGVDAITTGPMVSRPVIRGLSGNRVLTVVDGARFETQQWDEEHGIGVNELGTESIEVIKGPASLLYGPEAMGGIIHFVTANPAPVHSRQAGATAAVYSNNLGFLGKIGAAGAEEGYNWGVNALGRLLSDFFFNGYDFRVPNTRLMEFGGKGYFGLNRSWGSTRLSYLFNQATYGILDGKDLVRDPDTGQIVNTDSLEKEKFPFEVEAPFHEVTDHRLNWKTTLLAGGSRLVANFGYQNNHRSENEELSGSKKGYTYLDMVLQTATYDLKWHMPEWGGFHTIAGVQGMLQKNANREEAATVLIPDAGIRDLGFLLLERFEGDDFSASLGARYDSRHLKTDAVARDGDDIPSLTRDYGSLSGSAGLTWRPVNRLLVRASYASGYRSPNLNELLSDGVKLESRRFEVGNADFGKETNREGDLEFRFGGGEFTLDVSFFRNAIDGYIYLEPTGNQVPGSQDPTQSYPEYEFRQGKALIRGGEATLDIHPCALPAIHLVTRAATLKGTRRDDGSYLPVMPATKLENTLNFDLRDHGAWNHIFLDLGTETAFRQNQVSENEDETPGYTLLNAGMGASYHHTAFTLSARNLLNKVYLDHLSRFRSYAIPGPGLNVSLSVKIPIGEVQHGSGHASP